jgi:preprotein translocase subunit SecG
MRKIVYILATAFVAAALLLAAAPAHASHATHVLAGSPVLCCDE